MGDKLVLGAIKVLVDWGFDMDKNSANDLIMAVLEILEFAKTNKRIACELKDAIECNDEIVKEMWN